MAPTATAPHARGERRGSRAAHRSDGVTDDRAEPFAPAIHGSTLGPVAVRLRGLARERAGDPDFGLEIGSLVPEAFPLPGSGSTAMLWEALASVAAGDLTVARALEPHLDATAILAEAGASGLDVPRVHDGQTWGVFAAEGPGTRLTAASPASGEPGPARLSGTKPWCSLAGTLSHALVTAWCDDEHRRLYAVDLRTDATHVEPVPWVARGLSAVPSGPVAFDEAEAVPIGEPGWYLARPGFAWGGIGVAAVWFGGACAVAARLFEQCLRRTPDQVALMHLGAVDAALHAASATLADAARTVDAGEAVGDDGARLALRVRRVVADAVDEVLGHVDHALGPGPLALEEEHAARVADLRLYVRQEHAERDAAALGRSLLEASGVTP
ncbi:acyl-CoA dehydrogenase [Intrasporangium sp. YIM S08009]|uniref:acyl-CoA dehydrogenase n=1 Tax=Intrasporangium zincisolvens TaxID=3080018 RepID=UPI002B0552DA|nr:acyl-CoA dehydrogenase [Intrasporangium sp. YIM S08009]